VCTHILSKTPLPAFRAPLRTGNGVLFLLNLNGSPGRESRRSAASCKGSAVHGRRRGKRCSRARAPNAGQLGSVSAVPKVSAGRGTGRAAVPNQRVYMKRLTRAEELEAGISASRDPPHRRQRHSHQLLVVLADRRRARLPATCKQAKATAVSAPVAAALPAPSEPLAGTKQRRRSAETLGRCASKDDGSEAGAAHGKEARRDRSRTPGPAWMVLRTTAMRAASGAMTRAPECRAASSREAAAATAAAATRTRTPTRGAAAAATLAATRTLGATPTLGAAAAGAAAGAAAAQAGTGADKKGGSAAARTRKGQQRSKGWGSRRDGGRSPVRSPRRAAAGSRSPHRAAAGSRSPQ